MTFEERLERAKLFLFKVFVRSCAAVGAYRTLAGLAGFFVSECPGAPMVSRAPGDSHRLATVLILDFARFRGDIEAFHRTGQIRFLEISWSFLRYLLASYVYEPTREDEAALPAGVNARLEFAMARPGSGIFREREQYQAFLRRFMPHFMERFNIDVVVNSDYRFRRERDFAGVASALGYPHICYFREAMYVVPAIYNKAVDRYRIMAPFSGSVIAVQNEVTGQIFVDAGMADRDKIRVRGCPRMDSFLRQLQREMPDRSGAARQVAFFSWPPHVPLRDGKKFDLSSTAAAVVRALAEMARDDPTLRVVLKIKDQHMKGSRFGQIAGFEDIIRDVAGKKSALPNIVFETDRMAAQDVILQSDVVCAMQSTVVLEAAVAGKPVVLPHFDEMTGQRGADQSLMYQEYRDLFDRAKDADKLKDLVRWRLIEPAISDGTMAKRRELFECYVSPLDGHATETCLGLLQEFAARGRKARAAGVMVESLHGRGETVETG